MTEGNIQYNQINYVEFIILLNVTLVGFHFLNLYVFPYSDLQIIAYLFVCFEKFLFLWKWDKLNL
jgi:hypothetical protein